MVIDDLDVMAVAGAPDKTDPALVVNSNGMLTLSVALQGLQLTAGRRRQKAQFRGCMKLEQLSQGNPLEGSEPFAVMIIE